MCRNLTAEWDERGNVYVRVPAELLWEFVEYVSYRRISCDYHFETGDFRVVLAHQDRESVQRMLEEWDYQLSHDYEGTRQA